MLNFDDVYLHNYKVLDYSLIRQVLVASGPDAHLICQTDHFLVIQK
jgi:hypothetical protein